MALNTSKHNRLTQLCFKGLTVRKKEQKGRCLGASMERRSIVVTPSDSHQMMQLRRNRLTAPSIVDAMTSLQVRQSQPARRPQHSSAHTRFKN